MTSTEQIIFVVLLILLLSGPPITHRRVIRRPRPKTDPPAERPSK